MNMIKIKTFHYTNGGTKITYREGRVPMSAAFPFELKTSGECEEVILAYRYAAHN